MLAQERYNFILKSIEEKGSATVSDISKALNISIETVRRDLILLESRGKLKRVFGGAVAVDKPIHLESLETRLDSNTELKAEVASYAISFIENGDTIAIESGSTAVEMAKALLKTELNITVITNSNTVFNMLKDNFKVILVGGEYVAEDDCFCGVMTEEFLKSFHLNKAFIFPSALSITNGIESFLLNTINITRLLTEISDKVFVLFDNEKYRRRATFKVIELNKNFVYITDSNVLPEIKNRFLESGLTLFYGENEYA